MIKKESSGHKYGKMHIARPPKTLKATADQTGRDEVERIDPWKSFSLWVASCPRICLYRKIKDAVEHGGPEPAIFPAH